VFRTPAHPHHAGDWGTHPKNSLAVVRGGEHLAAANCVHRAAGTRPHQGRDHQRGGEGGEEPRAILNGTWKFPEAQPVEAGSRALQ